MCVCVWMLTGPPAPPEAAGLHGNQGVAGLSELRKRHRPFSAADFGQAVCKRLRGAREALLARIDRSELPDALAAGVAQAPAAASLRRLLLPSPDQRIPRASEGVSRVLLAHARPTLPERAAVGGAPMSPGVLAADYLRPLPKLRSERAPPQMLWDVSQRVHLELPSTRPRLAVRNNPLSYMDYLSWLQRVLPESMQPDESASTADEDVRPHKSALELLRELSAVARPKPPRGRRVCPLTAEERKLAERTLAEDECAGDIIANRFNVELIREKFWCLRPGEWLNDEIINFYLKLLQERTKNPGSARSCWFPNSFFWPKLSGADNDTYSYKDVKRWTIKGKVDIFALDYVVFPMNICESHWALGAIDIRESGFRYFDSMFVKPHRNFVPFLQRYVQDEHKARKGGPLAGVEDWDLLPSASPVPQQRNGFDCGVFTCFFADCLASGRELDFGQDDMPDLRLRLAARCARADEHWDDGGP